jgi:hypothetical protein
MGIGRATASFGVLIAIAGQAPLLAQTFTDSPAPRALHAPFVANDGQAHESVAFYAAMQGGTVAVDRSGELIYALATDDSSLVLTERLVGARVRSPRGDGLSPATINIYRGRDPTKWRHGVRAYDAVHLGDVYDGIEARVRAIGATVEKIFVVAPGARPDRIRIRLRGADRLAVSSTGALEARTTHGDVRFSKPIAYQEVNGRKIVVKASYTIWVPDWPL